MTFIRLGYGCAAKNSAAALTSSGVIPLAKAIMLFVFAFLGSALFRRPFLKSSICWMKYAG